jgi:hypothetical protein
MVPDSWPSRSQADAGRETGWSSRMAHWWAVRTRGRTAGASLPGLLSQGEGANNWWLPSGSMSWRRMGSGAGNGAGVGRLTASATAA